MRGRGVCIERGKGFKPVLKTPVMIPADHLVLAGHFDLSSGHVVTSSHNSYCVAAEHQVQVCAG